MNPEIDSELGRSFIIFGDEQVFLQRLDSQRVELSEFRARALKNHFREGPHHLFEMPGGILLFVF